MKKPEIVVFAGMINHNDFWNKEQIKALTKCNL